MNVQIDISSADQSGRIYLSWTPVTATARLVGGQGGGSVAVVLHSAGPGGGLLFDTVRTDHGKPDLTLSLPASGAPVTFWVAGAFQKPSSAYGDAVIEARDKTTGNHLGSLAMMVRVRKNAQTLSAPERDRFLAALGTLNAQGQGPYRDFRDMHVAISSPEMHGNVGFLPWHRAYVLDLERSLQAIDPNIAVPYWRFDQPAPAVFTQDFMGASDPSDRVVFRPGHALEHWVTDGQAGITRGLRFALNRPANVSNEVTTLNMGGRTGVFAQFHGMEGDPHGLAHTSFRGPISSVPTAVRDPLFFMLHANVDRLWAKWQWVKRRQNPNDPNAYATPSPNKAGHHLGDTMWPWNGITGNGRPPTAPGGPFPTSVTMPVPGTTPRVQDMFDHLAVLSKQPLRYAYDDVPFELLPTVVAGGP